jgi:hypothetical protein
MNHAYHRLVGATATATVGLLYLIVPMAVQAQSLQMTVKIPFEFYAGEQKFPAGDYKIMQQSIAGGSALLILGENKSRQLVTTPTTNPHTDRNTSIIFNKYAGDMFLAEAHWRGVDIGRKFLMSSLELALAKRITPERVVAGGNP